MIKCYTNWHLLYFAVSRSSLRNECTLTLKWLCARNEPKCAWAETACWVWTRILLCIFQRRVRDLLIDNVVTADSLKRWGIFHILVSESQHHRADVLALGSSLDLLIKMTPCDMHKALIDNRKGVQCHKSSLVKPANPDLPLNGAYVIVNKQEVMK